MEEAGLRPLGTGMLLGNTSRFVALFLGLALFDAGFFFLPADGFEAAFLGAAFFFAAGFFPAADVFLVDAAFLLTDGFVVDFFATGFFLPVAFFLAAVFLTGAFFFAAVFFRVVAGAEALEEAFFLAGEVDFFFLVATGGFLYAIDPRRGN